MPVRVGRVLEEDEQLDSPSAPPESPVEASAGEILRGEASTLYAVEAGRG